MYHSISRYPEGLCVTPETFEEHCSVLSKTGWRGISLIEAEEYFLRKRKLPKKVCLFTFDDGYLDNYVYAEPLLRRYGHQGVIFPVVSQLRESGTFHPTLDSPQDDPTVQKLLARLDQRVRITRSGLAVRDILFCSRQEIARMQTEGCMSAAPHSLRHDRVVRSLTFERLYAPRGGGGFFGVPTHTVPWGFPHFDLAPYLAYPNYEINPQLFELIKRIVPQTEKEASAFLKNDQNKAMVLREIAALGDLGRRETEAEYRARIYQEFESCREVFTEWLGVPPVSFCWPWGTYNAIALEEARKAGFRLFFTVARGVNLRGMTSSVHRIKVLNGWSGAKLLTVLQYLANPVLEGTVSLWAALR